jgi:hypothetical protein
VEASAAIRSKIPLTKLFMILIVISYEINNFLDNKTWIM